jgi:hypothetical protein
MRLKREFFKFLAGFLEDQGIGASEVYEAFAEEKNLSQKVKRDLADLLREEGYEVTQPPLPEGKVDGKTAAERAEEKGEEEPAPVEPVRAEPEPEKTEVPAEVVPEDEAEVRSRAQAEEQGQEEATVEFTANASARPKDETE